MVNKLGGFYDPEFTGDRFWTEVLVQCPECRSRHRKPADMDWSAHLTLSLPDDGMGVDLYGYFGVDAEFLSSGRVVCPQCRSAVTVVNIRPPRTLWMPLPHSRRNSGIPVIVENPVWEVVG